MIFVWSTRVNPCSAETALTDCRARTMSFEERSWITSRLRTIVRSLRERQLNVRAQQLHPPVHIERGAYPGERKPELHERDGDRGSHADDDRLCVENAS